MRPLAGLLLVWSAATGCGQPRYAPVPLYPVRGTVLFDSTPAAGARVRLHPLGAGGPAAALVPSGTAGPDGSFALTTYEAEDGAPAGEYVVTVVWPEPPGKGPPSPPADRLGRRYADPAKSLWKVTVGGGRNVLAPIVLTGPVSPGAARGKPTPKGT